MENLKNTFFSIFWSFWYQKVGWCNTRKSKIQPNKTLSYSPDAMFKKIKKKKLSPLFSSDHKITQKNQQEKQILFLWWFLLFKQQWIFYTLHSCLFNTEKGEKKVNFPKCVLKRKKNDETNRYQFSRLKRRKNQIKRKTK